MNRVEKEAVVAELKELFATSHGAFLVNYQGLTVAQIQVLRSKLRKDNARLKVAKARLFKIASEGLLGADELKSTLKEQVGIVFAFNEVPLVAKDIVTFAKENQSLKLVAGFFENRVISPAQISELAFLPSRAVMLAQLLGTLQAPLSGVARSLGALLLKLGGTLKALEKQKGGE